MLAKVTEWLDEVTDFGTREKPLVWEKDAQWNEVLDFIIT